MSLEESVEIGEETKLFFRKRNIYLHMYFLAYDCGGNDSVWISIVEAKVMVCRILSREMENVDGAR